MATNDPPPENPPVRAQSKDDDNGHALGAAGTVPSVASQGPKIPSKKFTNKGTLSDFEERSLEYQRRGLWIQLLATIAAVGSIVFLALQVIEQTKATKAQTAATEAQVEATKVQYSALDSSIYQDLMGKQLDLDKLFIEKPEAYAYVYGKERNTKAPAPPYVLAILSYHLDVFQLIFSQRSRLPELEEESGPSWTSWKNTMRDAFTNSPRLCKQFDENRDDYGSDFVEYVFDTNQWCADFVKPK